MSTEETDYKRQRKLLLTQLRAAYISAAPNKVVEVDGYQLRIRDNDDDEANFTVTVEFFINSAYVNEIRLSTPYSLKLRATHIKHTNVASTVKKIVEGFGARVDEAARLYALRRNVTNRLQAQIKEDFQRINDALVIKLLDRPGLDKTLSINNSEVSVRGIGNRMNETVDYTVVFSHLQPWQVWSIINAATEVIITGETK